MDITVNIAQNLTSTTREYDRDLLTDMNNAMAIQLIPLIVFLSSLIVIGVPGNIMVLCFYGRMAKPTSNSIFICALAMYDVTRCCVSLPMEIVDLQNFYTFDSAVKCKLLRFLNYQTTVGSGLTLVAVAFDRYRRICRPFQKQLTMMSVKITSTAIALGTLLITWPAIALYNSESVDVTTDTGVKLVGKECAIHSEKTFMYYVAVFDGVQLILFLFCLIVLTILYTKVGRILFKHKKVQKRRGSIPYSCTNSVQPTKIKTNVGEIFRISKQDFENISTKQIPIAKSEPSSEQVYIKTKSYTVMMLIITTVFFLSFLPYAILEIWSNLDKYNRGMLSGAATVLYQIGIRSYFLNAAINPLTYGFFNSRFRNYYKNMFCHCCYRSADGTEQVSNKEQSETF